MNNDFFFLFLFPGRTDNSSIADAFNSFFATIGDKLANNVEFANANNHYSHYMEKLNLTISSMYITPVSEEEVLKIIKKA